MQAQLTVSGRLTRDLEVKQVKTPNGNEFLSGRGTIAFNESKDKANFLNFEVVGGLAQTLATYTGKGCRVVLVGSLTSYLHEDKTYWKLNVQNADIIDFKEVPTNPNPQPQAQASGYGFNRR